MIGVSCKSEAIYLSWVSQKIVFPPFLVLTGWVQVASPQVVLREGIESCGEYDLSVVAVIEVLYCTVLYCTVLYCTVHDPGPVQRGPGHHLRDAAPAGHRAAAGPRGAPRGHLHHRQVAGLREALLHQTVPGQYFSRHAFSYNWEN